MDNNLLICVFIFVFGLVFGSFYNVVGYRLPNDMSIIFPPSHCPRCNHKLKYYELIPIISYIFLRGKCKECKNKISFKYPLFELITAILFLISYLIFGMSINFFIAITFISVLIIITISDLESFIIPDEVIIVGAILIIIEYIISFFLNKTSFTNQVIMPIINGLASFIILYLIKKIGDFSFKKESLGGGDVKLMFLIGMVLGIEMSVFSIFLASFIALPISIILLLKKDSNIIPFGPFISLSAVIILLTNLNINSIINFIS